MSFLEIEGLLAPHAGQPVRMAGAPLETANTAMVLIHGRGANAQSILTLADELGDQPGVAYLAPQATGNQWYPNRFMAPIQSNEPDLSSALALVDAIVERLAEHHNIPHERIVLLGFSQGACLATEYTVRHPRRYGGVVGLSGGLIGPPGTTWDTSGDLAGTPVFLGCSDRDPHIPQERVEESAAVFEQMGADVTKRIYPNMGHTVNQDEIDWVRSLLGELLIG